MDTVSVADWGNYLAVLAESAATLTGLVFVAVSINLSRIVETPGLPGRAAESILQLFGVVLIATTALIPKQPATVLGVEVLGAGVVLWVLQTVLQVFNYRRRNKSHPRIWVISRMVQTHLATLPFCVSGILLIEGWPSGLYWLAPGFMFSLMSGVLSAWVLLVEILR